MQKSDPCHRSPVVEILKGLLHQSGQSVLGTLSSSHLMRRGRVITILSEWSFAFDLQSV